MDSATVIRTLAHPTRLNILKWLKDPERYFGPQEYPMELGVCANQFQRDGMAQSTASGHLKALTDADLLSSRKIGQWRFYRRNERAISNFLRQLAAEI
ncbi:ArsR/SmtB family transcription factor [Rhizobium leguminosarum]|uniref:ArsR/SmtB family transcription factor n=1 Tax=Rhizobium leguminosarum TaxID=384 RepID=UPI00047F6CC3|nr:metalloregulator ArsR/SmtB family transcription factor [Rhizobium leguminosarum]QIO76219.1 helix-turn-helix transcriptional regulator [Rhizobium leguminosarum bv. trifolii]QIO83237.1 helix-turn-helix transcriptional regulator [Rhizobium leguminosarum bv. trifolii]TAU16511.1 transcriptional regulator [Rhizobium leguminosarum]TAU34795.1 transcriptional regulator [Rhizobium leguminosarum]TAX44027.1 transcriptional regulator [Rhizobium leguminosarum]